MATDLERLPAGKHDSRGAERRDIMSGAGRFGDFATLILERRKRDDVLLVLPFYTNYPAMFSNLGLLAKQGCQDFDVIIVANAVSDEKKILAFIEKLDMRYGIVLAKRNEDTGSAGGYFTGEKYALEKGYGAVVHVDDDCLPVSPDLLGKLISRWKAGALVAGTECRFLLGSEVIYSSKSTVFYGLVDSSLLGARGLHYVPMYMGADDLEFGYRVVHGEKTEWVDSFVTHPARHSIFANFERSLLYRINTMLMVIPRRLDEYMYGFALVCPTYIIFGSERAHAGGLHMLRCVLAHRFGKDALPKEMAYGEKPPERFGRVVSSSKLRKEKEAVHYDYSQIRGGFSRLPAFAMSVLGNVVLLDLVQNFSVLASMMFAKETWVESNRGTYCISRNQNPLTWALKLLLFAIVFPLFAMLGLLTFPVNWARKPDTRGYGVK